MKKKAIVAVVALVLVLCFAIGGTLAWLKTETTPVVNTFTYGDINIGLSESENLNLKMIPGNPIHKDPTVTVETGSEACWLFVKVDESNNFDDFMTYAIAEGWTFFNTTATGDEIDTDTNDGYVIYRQVDDTIDEQQNTNFAVLNNNEVLVKNTVTKGMLNAEDFEKPTLTFTAYAVQQDKSLHNGLRAMLCSVGRAFDADLSAAVGQRGALGVFCLNLNSVCRAFISTNSPVPTSYRKYERLRKLMYGYKLNVPYPDFQGELFVNNRIPFIYITDNHEYFNIMKYHYGAKSIELPGCSSHNIENGVFHDWYKEDFADYGQYCLGKSSAQPFPKMNITEDRIIKRFIKDICILDENADIPKAELTAAYENYFRKFYGETTLKPKHFKNKIAVIANLSDCRPHHSSKSNPICFKGIKIDEEKYAELLELPNEENFKTDIESFGDALFDLIYKDTMPPEEYEHAKRRFVSNKGVKIKLSEKH